MSTLEKALFDDAGNPRQISRIEIEPLESGSCRWNLFSDGHRIYSAVAPRSQVPAMLEATAVIVSGGDDPREVSHG